jgi:hypothetical protein
MKQKSVNLSVNDNEFHVKMKNVCILNAYRLMFAVARHLSAKRVRTLG